MLQPPYFMEGDWQLPSRRSPATGKEAEERLGSRGLHSHPSAPAVVSVSMFARSKNKCWAVFKMSAF